MWRRRVRHIVYSCVPRGDAKTVRLRGAVEAAGGLWREVSALSEPDLARLVHSDGVDILVDLTGHTANNRLGAFAMRPAPLQVPLPPCDKAGRSCVCRELSQGPPCALGCASSARTRRQPDGDAQLPGSRLQKYFSAPAGPLDLPSQLLYEVRGMEIRCRRRATPAGHVCLPVGRGLTKQGWWGERR